MKRCLTCHHVYSDESLKFCRVDGSTLLNISAADAEAESASTLLLSPRAGAGSATHGLGDDGVAHETIPPTNVGTSKLQESSTEGVRARWRWLIILLSVLVVAAAALALYIRARNAIGPIESIAVLPLASENRDGEPDRPPVAVRSFNSESRLPVPAMPPPDDSRGRRFTGNQKSRDEVLKVLAASLTDDIRYDLARLPNLSVIPGSDASPHTEKDVRNVDDERKPAVHAVFSGRIEQYSGVLVISVKLVDERHKKLIWGRRYTDFTDEQLPAKRLEISQQLAECLRQNRQGKHCEN